jgi:HEAT repeat protein
MCGACGGNKKGPRMVKIPRPKEAPLPPPRQDVPMDPALVDAAKREVNKALQSSDPLVRIQALEALRNVPGADAENHIVNALRDRDGGVRFAAAMMAGELRVASASPVLLGLADTERDPNVSVAVRFALHKLGDANRSQDLVTFARNEDPRVRRNVALVLGLLGEQSARSKILRVMRGDIDPLVREQALEALWRLGDEEALKPLIALTVSGYADDRIIGLLALAAPKRQIVREHVRGLLAGDDVQVEVTLVAARAMGMLGSDEGYKLATDATRSPDPNQRFLAAAALGAIGRTDAQNELRRLLGDSVPNVQLAAASALLEVAQHQPNRG